MERGKCARTGSRPVGSRESARVESVKQSDALQRGPKKARRSVQVRARGAQFRDFNLILGVLGPLAVEILLLRALLFPLFSLRLPPQQVRNDRTPQRRRRRCFHARIPLAM